MNLSVIIPTCNRNSLLERCLNELHPTIQRENATQYEIIVTDDSKEGLAKGLIESQYPWVNWIQGPKKGPAANRNNGAKYAKGKWLIFLDDDCIPDKNLIAAYYNAIKLYSGINVFEGCIKADRDKKNFIEESPINEGGGNLWSCNFMISATLFNKLNGFDSAFPYAAMEDVDLHVRIKKLSEKIQFVKEAFVVHPWRIEKNIIFKTTKRFQSTLYFLKKHPEMGQSLNVVYFTKSSAINFKNAFKYAYKFKFRGFDKQLILSVLHLYFAAFLFFQNVKNHN